jgi:aminopeptidase N
MSRISTRGSFARALTLAVGAVLVGALAVDALATTPLAAVRAAAEHPGARDAAGPDEGATADGTPHVAPPPAEPVATPPPQPVASTPARVAGASQIVPGTVNRSTIRMTATYAVNARLNVAARTLRGSVSITARNDLTKPVDRVRLNTVMGLLGRLDLGQVTVDGNPVRATLDDQTITVRLGGLLNPGATAVIVVPFRATLRSTISGHTWLFTRADGVVSMYRWVPWISRATPFDRPNHGDPFVTPVSPSVTVRIRTDVPTRVVVNGTRTSRSDDGLVTTWTLENVRDVVVNAASDYRTVSRTVGDTAIRVHMRPGQPAAAVLDAAEAAVRRLEDRLGRYPWDGLRIVQSAGGYGMEGPGIVWIPAGVAPGNLRYLVTHEVAHQWFYGEVGNDQAREPFADEAMADMVARFVLGQRRGSRCAAGRLDRSIYDYSTACYYEKVYIQGGNLLDDARRDMGNAAFFGALRDYIRAQRWELSHTKTLLDTIDDATSINLAARWRSRFPSLY